MSKFINIILFVSFIPTICFSNTEIPDDQGMNDLSLSDILDIEVTTTSKKKESALLAPANIFVITETEIQNRGYKGLTDIFNDLPGVVLFSPEPSEGVSLGIRGIRSMTRFKILFDGMAVSPKTATEFFFGVNRFPVDRIKQVEFINGPYPALYGRNSFSGVINIISKNGEKFNGTSISFAEALPYEESKIDIVHGKKYGKFNVLLNVYGNKSTKGRDLADEYPNVYSEEARRSSRRNNGNGEFDTSVPTEFKQPYETLDFYAKIEHDNNFSLYSHYNHNIAPKIGVDLHPDTYYSNEDTNSNEVWHNHKIQYKKKFGTSTSTTSLSYQRYSVKMTNGYLDNKTKIIKEQSDGYEFNQRYRFKASEKNELLVGINAESIYHKYQISSDRIFNTPEPTWDPNQIKNESFLSGTIQDDYQHSPSLKIVTGLFYDTSNIYSSILLPRIAIIKSHSQELSSKLFYSKGHEQPEPTLRRDTVVAQVSDSVKGSEDLNPETIDTIELDITYRKKNSYSLSFTPFYSKVINSFSTISCSTCGSKFGLKATNGGSKEIYGTEVFLRANLPRNISFWASYGFVQGRQYVLQEDNTTETIDPLTVSAQHHIKLGLNIPILSNKLNINIHDLFIEGTDTPDTDRDDNNANGISREDFKTKSFNIVNLHISSTPNYSKKWSFSFLINNIFNETGAMSPIDNSSARVLQYIPRINSTIKAKYKF